MLRQWFYASESLIEASLLRKFVQLPIFKQPSEPETELPTGQEFYLSLPKPNPANNSATFQISTEANLGTQFIVFNSLGEKIATKNISNKDNSLTLLTSDFPAGSYSCRLIHENKMIEKKLVVIH